MTRVLSVSRRDFVGAVAAGAAGSLTRATDSAAEGTTEKANVICAFTKPFQSLRFSELADRIAELGFDGIEATVREGGHIEPARARDELPALVEALRGRGLEVTIMASSINRVDEPHAKEALRTAAHLGIKRYRMKYYTYDLRLPIRKQLDEIRPVLRDLAAFNRELGITGLYHNHAGPRYVGAPVWDAYELIREVPTDAVAMGFDIRHATVEGGECWPVHFKLVQPHLGAVFIKDFRWEDGRVRNVPLGEGWVSRDFFSMLKQSGYRGPVSLHEEYLDHRDPALVPRHLAALRADLRVLRSWLGA